MKTILENAIREHGRQLQAIFPATATMDALTLCRKLRRLEARAQAFALRGCNGPQWSSEEAREHAAEDILRKVDAILNYIGSGVPVFLNTDPRGYSIKIDEAWMRKNQTRLHRDWGGYGIIAPEITGK